MGSKTKTLQLFIVLTLLLGLLGPAAVLPADPGVARAHPLLVDVAAEDPQQVVSVIVQKLAQDMDLEPTVAELGGEITKDLHIINAFAAEMSAEAVLELARDDGVRWVSLDAPVERAGKPVRDPDPELPANTYLETLDVQPVWDMGIDGSNVTVAVIDSGISTDRDFSTEPGKPFSRIVKQISFSESAFQTADIYGHGTHVTGIIGGNGTGSDGFYKGIAPKVDLINLKISDDTGMAYESEVVAAMQWVYDNKDIYNIRVVNLSINSTVESSYHTSPMDAAAEILWFNGVVVIASAGNYWDGLDFNPVLAAPANDPFIITVGATTEKVTTRIKDDVIANFSAFGTTQDGYFKPDIYAPGRDIISVLASSSPWDQQYPDRVVLAGEYFRLSGTSMAAPMVTGAVALLLHDEPDLTPDQVKYRLINTAGWIGPSKYLNIYDAVTGTTTESANTGITASQLLWTGDEPITWGSVAWNSVAWNSVAWNSVAWNSVAWNSVAWNSVAWND